MSLLAIAKPLYSERKRIVTVVGSLTVFAALASLLLTDKYRSEATIMPLESRPSQMQSVMKAIEGTSVLGALGSGLAGALGSGNSVDKFQSILKSRVLSERVITSLNLMPVFFRKWDFDQKRWKFPRSIWKSNSNPPAMEDAVFILKDMVTITNERKGLLMIQAQSPNPELAASVANRYVLELQEFMNKNSLSLAKKNRIFLEEQLKSTQASLFKAEEDLKGFQETHRLFNVEKQAEITMKTAANLQAQLINNEMELGMLRSSGREGGPEMESMQQQQRQLRKQLNELDVNSAMAKDPNRAEKTSGLMTRLDKLPDVVTAYLRLKREVMIQEQVFELLTSQYELAKIEEVKDDAAFQIIDPAVPRVRPYWPNRRLAISTVFLLSLLLTSYGTITRDKKKLAG